MKTKRVDTPSMPLVLRIGVTGEIPTSEDDKARFRTKVKAALSLIRDKTQRFLLSHQDIYSLQDSPKLRLITTLCEGVPLLTAQVAHNLDFELHCPLPFNRKLHRDYLTNDDSRTIYDQLIEGASMLELCGDSAKRAECELNAARTVLRHCDLLIAAHSSNPIKEGAQIIPDALKLGIPIIWISTNENHDSCLWNETHIEDLENLGQILKAILLLPEAGSSFYLQRYREEKQPKWTLGLVFKLFCRFWVRNWSKPKFLVKNFSKSASGDWEELWAPLIKVDPRTSDALRQRFFPEFARADGLAEYYANKYQSSFVATYLMGATAILLAFLGSQEGAPEYFLLGELALISAILFITFRGRSQGWHERWIDYRVLAEELRQMQFLIIFGRVTSSFRVPAHMEQSDPRRKWFNWHFRAVVRNAGIVNAKLEKENLEAFRLVILRWIESQKKYHLDSEERHEKLHKRLHWTAQALFGVTFFACVFHLLPEYSHWVESILSMLKVRYDNYELGLSLGAIVLPAFGGALGAILHIGEFERISLRSKALKGHLTATATQLEQLVLRHVRYDGFECPDSSWKGYNSFQEEQKWGKPM